MSVKLLDTVVLLKNLPGSTLQQGDIGTVVAVYEPDGIEVEFVSGSGNTQALITLKSADVRPIDSLDMLAVRSLDAA